MEYRLVTKSNIDGVVSAILLHEIGMIEEVCFVQEEEIREKKISLSMQDIVVNLPFVKGVYQAFDYHDNREGEIVLNENHLYDCMSNSASALIYETYHDKFHDTKKIEELVEIANRESSHTLTTKERLDVYAYYEKRFEKQLQEA